MSFPPPTNPSVSIADGRGMTPEEELQQQMGMGGQPGQQQPVRGQGQPPLSEDEMRIISECRSESNIYRGVPGSLLAGFAAYTAQQRGLMKVHATYGPGPKIAVCGVIGFLVGRFTYANVCAEKFLTQAPDSNIARTIREAREGRPRGSIQDGGQGQMMESRQQPFKPHQQIMQQQQQQQQQQFAPPPTEVPTQASSYDELRNRSRGILNSPPPVQPPQRQQDDGGFQGGLDLAPGPSSPMDAPPSKLRKRVNQYGDEVYD